jgi:molybdenum cofactor biosynthesis protein MoaC
LPKTIRAIRSGNLPKADPIAVARVAGIQAAKNTSLLIPYCHQVPLDFVRVEMELRKDRIEIAAEVKAVWKTGVEMEALAAASGAALTLYDMLKIIDERMEITTVKLDLKRGGKSDFHSEASIQKLRAAVLVLSDKASRGEREEKSGRAIVQRLRSFGLKTISYKVLPDEADLLRNELLKQCDQKKVDLVLTTGGTGLSPRDITPDVAQEVIERRLDGVSERLRSFGQERIRTAMLSRGIAGVRGTTVIVTLPGSPNAVNESLDVLLPWLFHSFRMMRGEEH